MTQKLSQEGITISWTQQNGSKLGAVGLVGAGLVKARVFLREATVYSIGSGNTWSNQIPKRWAGSGDGGVDSSTASVMKTDDTVSREVSVLAFGARGDGSTDDTTAFLAALATSRLVSVPNGTFLIRKTLVLRDGQSLRGQGEGNNGPRCTPSTPPVAFSLRVWASTHESSYWMCY